MGVTGGMLMGRGTSGGTPAGIDGGAGAITVGMTGGLTALIGGGIGGATGGRGASTVGGGVEGSGLTGGGALGGFNTTVASGTSGDAGAAAFSCLSRVPRFTRCCLISPTVSWISKSAEYCLAISSRR